MSALHVCGMRVFVLKASLEFNATHENEGVVTIATQSSPSICIVDEQNIQTQNASLQNTGKLET